MKKNLLLVLLFLKVVTNASAQNNVGIGILTPDPSSALDVSATDKGILIPRITTNQRDLISAPANGLMIYNIDSNCLNYYKLNQWRSICDEINNAANNAMPCGSIIMWGGSITQIPTGWYLCDGTNNTPDLRDKFIRGSSGTSDHLTSGGNDQVTLTVNQLPAHTHGVNDPGHNHNYIDEHRAQGNGGSLGNGFANNHTSDYYYDNKTTNNRQTGISIQSTGGGQAIPILPSYYKLAYIKKCN